MKFINCTPHPLDILDLDYEVQSFPKCETPARCEEHRYDLPNIEPYHVSGVRLGEIVDLPEQRHGVTLIVSAIVANHESTRFRDDLVSPGVLKRDSDGKVIGAAGFSAGIGMRESYADCGAEK